MIKYILIFILSLIFATTTEARVAMMPVDPPSQPKTQCTIKVAYGSYGSRLDYKTIEKIDALLNKYQNDIDSASSEAVGFEGGSDMCLKIKDTQKAEMLYRKIKSIIPKYSKIGWTSIEMAGKKKYQTQWPQHFWQ